MEGSFWRTNDRFRRCRRAVKIISCGRSFCSSRRREKPFSFDAPKEGRKRIKELRERRIKGTGTGDEQTLRAIGGEISPNLRLSDLGRDAHAQK